MNIKNKAFLFNVILLIFFYFPVSIEAQELPPVKNFTPVDYNAGNQSWDIAQSEDKIIYVANNSGLLEYNGARWTRYDSPNETIMRSVMIHNDTIYTGCYMEFGFWTRNQTGRLQYSSISNQIESELLEDEEFWNILHIDNHLLFQSLKKIYIYNKRTKDFKTIDSQERIVKVYNVGNDVFFQRINKGIYKIENGKGELFIDDELIKRNEVIDIYSYKGKYIFLTQEKGFFVYENGLLKPWNGYNSQLSNYNTYCSYQLDEGKYILGTISNGILFFDFESGISDYINQSNSLLNNTVLSLFEDSENNIWAGLDNGISFINIESPVYVYNDKNGVLGSIYASAYHKGYLYFGTNQGLFFKLNDSDSDFKLIKGTEGQVWSLDIIDGKLICGHHRGTFLIENSSILRVSDIQGAWKNQYLSVDNGTIIQGNYDGISIHEFKNGKWNFKHKIKGFNYSSRYFEVMGNQIFVNHEYKGVIILTVNEGFTEVIDFYLDNSLKGANSSVAKFNSNILYASKSGIYSYNTESNKFTIDSTLSNAYSSEEYITGRMINDEVDERIWLFTRNNLVSISSDNLVDNTKIKKIPIGYNLRREVIDYENILHIDQFDKFIIGTTSGYIALSTENINVNEFKVYISDIYKGFNKEIGSEIEYVNYQEEGKLENEENNITINYHTPEYYNYLSTEYQYQLIGLYDEWSNWTSQSSEVFENLPPGKYTYNVRSRIGQDLSSNVATYQFYIAKPWYLKDVMLLLYFSALVMLIILFHNAYRSYYRRQRNKLIENNKKSIELMKLQKEKEIIKIKNDQLKQDYNSKSKELAASAMSIVKQNELLNSIKDHLIKSESRDELKPVIRIIDKNLAHNESWEMFKEAFENADAEFFRKLQEKHPDLSNNELKLCAYLRLNLTSKEIGPLFNISTRSVEVKRYRLRKKMNLDVKENLTNYILNV